MLEYHLGQWSWPSLIICNNLQDFFFFWTIQQWGPRIINTFPSLVKVVVYLNKYVNGTQDDDSL